ncbi:hypothetical protein HDF16_000429 [Granulicella aggregans]|uniref:Carboxypeptidase regulatory-like domain-containing protein n=1 Tax=Granulicella aggregans TaxID=474949 RepID=A0A7W8E341_9BACT|nr:hypothetical protein [Granulicella aggregans]MBB5055760.1 hypothetical protein [Granulicella aggregans]
MKLSLALVCLLCLVPTLARSQKQTQEAAQSKASDPSAALRNKRDFVFILEDDATHQPLADTQVDLEATSSDGAVAPIPGTTDSAGTISASLNPKLTYSITVHAVGYDDVTENWSASGLSLEIPLHANPNAVRSPYLQPQQEPEVSDSGQAPQPQPPDIKAQIRTFLVGLFFVVLPVAGFFVLRELAVRTVHFFMMRRGAPKLATAPVEEPGPTPEVMPGFLEMNTLNGILLSGPAEARVLRAEGTSGRKLKIFELSLLVQVCGLACAVGLIAWLMPTVFAADIMQIGIGSAALLVIDALLAFYAWTTWLQGARLVELLAGLSVVATIAITVVGLREKIPVFLVIPAVVQIACLVQGFRKLRGDARKDGNRKLVILRVFGSDKNTAFTFGKLMEQWRFIGSFLTIVDPAYIRHRFSVLARGSEGRSLGVTLTVGTLAALADQGARFAPLMLPQVIPTAWASLPPDQLLTRVRAVLYLVLAVIAVIPMLVYIWRHFLKSPAQAVAGVERVSRSTLSLETDYHGSPFFCYDDVWQPAVRNMLSVADVVLMDLRGFSAERQGCAYELGELVDHYPVDRLLFLVDALTPRDLLHKLMLERWAKMRGDSPNRAIAEPIIQLYETADRSASDIQHIASLLSASLDGRVQARAQLMYWGTGEREAGDLWPTHSSQ